MCYSELSFDTCYASTKFSVYTKTRPQSYPLSTIVTENKLCISIFFSFNHCLAYSQDAATVEYGAYKIAFEAEQVSLPHTGGRGKVNFTCQREKMINGKSKGFENCSLNGIRYKATQKNDATYSIEKSAETGVYMLKYVVLEAVTIHEVSNTFYFLYKEGEKIASLDIILAANSNGDDSHFMSTEISGIYKELL